SPRDALGDDARQAAAINEAAPIADALVVQSGQDAGLSNQRSAFESRPERVDRWQKSPCTPLQRETMQVQVLPDPSPRWLKEWERPPRKREACRCKSGPRPRTRSSTGQRPSLPRNEMRVRIPSRPPCPR